MLGAFGWHPLLTQTDFMEGMGMYYSGWMAKNKPQQESNAADLPHFLGFKNLQPFIGKHLGDLQSIVVKYRTDKGKLAHGIKAEIIQRFAKFGWMQTRRENLARGRSRSPRKRRLLCALSLTLHRCAS